MGKIHSDDPDADSLAGSGDADSPAEALARSVTAIARDTLRERKALAERGRGKETSELSGRVFEALHRRLERERGEILRERHRVESGISRDGAAKPEPRERIRREDMDELIEALRRAREDAKDAFDGADQARDQLLALITALMRAMQESRTRLVGATG